MTRQEIREWIILSNSPERVINTTLEILVRSRHPDSIMNAEDWRAIKEIVVDLWNEERNRIFIARTRSVQDGNPVKDPSDDT
jgi:hypothetical protein